MMQRANAHVRRIATFATWASMLVALVTLAQPLLGSQPAQAQESSSSDLAKRIARYRKDLAAYEKARAAYDRVADPYWRRVTQTRTQRRSKLARGQRVTLNDYVLEQPPPYTGPDKPIDPEAHKKPRPIPTSVEFLKHAKTHFGFVPEMPRKEWDYKLAYARAASAAGLGKRTCVKIYGFESGGNGTYDIQAGREYSRKARVISTALGYNQLLTTNSVELVAEQGDKIMKMLRRQAQAAAGGRKDALEQKMQILAKMIRFTRTVPDTWSAHVRLGETERGIGVHALVLDVDIGPLLQTEKLLTSVVFARRKGFRDELTAAELEMMNLTGDGNGYDMLQMSETMRRKVPTSNFFQRRGYERNPVAIRHNTVAKLMAATDAKMEREARLAGAQELAAAFDAAAQRTD